MTHSSPESAPSARGLVAGMTIDDRFVLERPLGEGAFGVVWRARDLRHPPHAVAIKFLHAEQAMDAEVVRRFVNEAKLLETFQHPHIAQARGFGTFQTRPYLALEFLDGVSLEAFLARRIANGSILDLATVERLFAELCSAVEHAHAHGVVHRDLKPENVMLVTVNGLPRVKLLDLGIAKIASSVVDKRTTEGRILGSPLYMAPEQWKGEAIDVRADVFALGAILYELFTLHKAFLGPGEVNMVKVFHSVMSGPRPDPAKWRGDLSDATRTLVKRALERDRNKRPSTVSEMLAALRASLSIAPTFTPTPAKPRVPWRAVSAGLLGGACLVAGALWWTSRAPPAPAATVSPRASKARGGNHPQPDAEHDPVDRFTEEFVGAAVPLLNDSLSGTLRVTAQQCFAAHDFSCAATSLANIARTDTEFAMLVNSYEALHQRIDALRAMRAWHKTIPLSALRDVVAKAHRLPTDRDLEARPSLGASP